MAEPSRLESLIRRDRAIVLSTLVVITALAWVYLVQMAIGMSDMAPMSGGAGMTDMPANGGAMAGGARPWTAMDAVLMLVMWVVMMTGMMLPSAAPMILLYGLVIRRQAGRGVVFAPTGAFAAGYLIAWTGFSVLVVALQWLLQTSGWLTPMMAASSPWLAGGVLVAAGIYQWTPWKGACLTHCRHPAEFLSRSWRKGTGGAVAMGIHHGLYCVGCCWALMLVLFAGGVMNLLLVAGIAALVLVEKLAPGGPLAARITGGAAIAAGTGVIVLS